MAEKGPGLPEEREIDGCMGVDRPALRRWLKGLRKRAHAGRPDARGLERLKADIVASQERLQRHRAALPAVTYPPELPITQCLEEIQRLISRHQVVVLCGETGSGKSTQLPKICLALGRGVGGYIGHTQPRRIAARSLASRIASELGVEPGSAVGHKVRFSDHVGAETHIKLMTDGILLAEIQQDPYLDQYDTLIIDEAHERSLNIDFLLGYLKRLLPRRPDLKLIVTSATIDPQRFANHFNNAPVIEVSGRTYPVELRYRPPRVAARERDEPMQQAIVDAVDELSRSGRGDILVFLRGEREIRETAETLRKHRLELTEVLPLYARLGPAEQQQVFRSHRLRRIVLATNVAETSLTVPGIHYVIDPGFARISRYSHRSKVQRLPVERISQASADQRKGRCGRVAEGICIRLYDEAEFASRAEFTEPEIQRTHLASVILRMKLLGFGEIEGFPFLDPPDRRLLKDGYRTLQEIGALDARQRVTPLGRQLARLPVDPRIGRMLLAAARGHCLSELLVIAAALSLQDPRERPLERQQQADEAHARFQDADSDFLGYLGIWRELQTQWRHLSKHKFRRYCRDHFLSWNRVQEWRDIHTQLRLQMHDMGFRENQKAADYEAIHRALLSGLLSHIGCRTSQRDYLGARNSRFHLFPGSGLFKKPPKWVMAAELVETSRLYARTAAVIQPAWVEAVAGPLLRRSYSEPHWEKRRGQVAGYEKVSLYGLTLVARRKVNFGPIDPPLAREIFIRSALVDGDFHTRAPFWRHNQELIAALRDLEAKSRRRDILVDEERIHAFYERRIPEGVYTTAAFEQWLKRDARDYPKRLYLRKQDLLREDARAVSSEQFPDRLTLNGMQLPLEYCFDPGRQADGVTLVVPRSVLGQVTAERLQWLVPGLLRERVIALLRGLPKSLRKSFVPVPDYADACLKGLEPSDRSLHRQLGERLKQLTGVHVPEDAWNEGALPEHLRMQVRLVDEQGRTLARSRSLGELRRLTGPAERDPPHRLAPPGLERSGLVAWDFGELPERLVVEQGGIRLIGFPALQDQGDSVAIRLLDNEVRARRNHQAGVRRLILLRLGREVRYLRKNLPGLERMRLQYARVPDAPEGLMATRPRTLEEELLAHIVDQTFLDGRAEIRDPADFETRIAAERGRLMTLAQQTTDQVGQILGVCQRLRKQLAETTQINWIASVSDMQAQLAQLVFKGFLQQIPAQRLGELPRYLRALELRLEKLPQAAARDRRRLREMASLYEQWQVWERRCREQGRIDERIEELRWHFEELRVSLFAQELGTAYPISLKRIERRWRELGL